MGHLGYKNIATICILTAGILYDVNRFPNHYHDPTITTSMKIYTQCKDCGTTDERLLYRSKKMPRCVDCQHYDNLSKKPTGGGVFFSREEFLEWRNKEGNRECVYCKCDGNELYERGILNVRNKKRYEVIGVDRIDNNQPYKLENIVPCCGPCNSIRGSILTHSEMLDLSSKLSSIWEKRKTLPTKSEKKYGEGPGKELLGEKRNIETNSRGINMRFNKTGKGKNTTQIDEQRMAAEGVFGDLQETDEEDLMNARRVPAKPILKKNTNMSARVAGRGVTRGGGR